MEASVAVDGGAQGAEAEAGSEAAEAAAGLDPAEVMARFDAMQGSMEEMRGQLTAAQQQQLATEEPGAEELDLTWLDPTAPEFDPQDFQQRVGDLIARAGQEAAAPALNAVAELQRKQEAAALRSEYPEIAQPETAQAVIAGASELANAVMADIAPVLQASGVPPQLIDAIGQGIVSSPATWRAVYLGSKGVDAAKAETPVDEAAALLEGGSGPRPAGSQELDPAQQIVAARGGGVLPF